MIGIGSYTTSVPELDYAMLAEHVRIDHGVAYILAGGLDGIEISEMPMATTINLLVRIGFNRAECGRPHRVEVLVQDEDGARMFHLTRTLRPEWPEGYPVTWNRNEQFKLGFPLHFKRYGVYECAILLNDSLLKTIPFIVRRADAGHPQLG